MGKQVSPGMTPNFNGKHLRDGGFEPGAVQQQYDSGREATQYQTNANRPNIDTPFGSQNWSKDAAGHWHMNTSYAPGMEGSIDSLQGQMANNYAQPFDNGSAARQKSIDATYGQATSRLDPQWGQREEQLQSRLANQGLDPSSEAYGHAMGDFSRERNDAYTSAMNNAVTNGNQAQALTFGENAAARDMPLHELQGMQGFLQMPGYNAAGSWAPVQSVAGDQAAWNANLQRMQVGNEASGQFMSGITNMAGGLFGF
jgi:hypothetical protein